MKKFTLVALLAIVAMVTSIRSIAQSGSTEISTAFTATDIPAGRELWLASGLQVTGTPTYPLTIHFRSQTISCSAFTISVPDGELILDPSYPYADTRFDGVKWITTAPPGQPGNYFIAAGKYIVGSTLPGGQNPVTWSGTFTASQPGVALNWQWWSASYQGVNPSTYDFGIKSSDCSSCARWGGSDYAGTPQITVRDASGFNRYTAGGTGYTYTGSASVTAGSESTTPTVTINASATTVCAGESITFTATPSNGGTTPSYQWKVNGANAGTNSPTFVLGSPANGQEVSVVLTSSDPSSSPATATSNTITVTVNTAPAAATLSGPTSVCAGGVITVGASTPGGTWSSSNTDVAYTSPGGHVTGVAAGSAIISYTLSNTCGTALSTTTVNVASGFTVNGTLTSPSCNGYTNGSIVTSVSPRRGQTYTYAWSNGSSSFGLWGVAAGTYTLTVTNKAGCRQTATYTVTQPEPLTSTHSVTNVYPSGGNNGAIYYGVAGGAWPYTYSWSNGATSQNITGLTSGSYWVTVTDANSCTLTNWFEVREPFGSKAGAGTASAAMPEGASFSAYPNPFYSETMITFFAQNDGNTNVDVYSAVTGAKVATIFNELTRAGQQYSCKLSGAQLTSGVYIFKVVTADKTPYTGKVVLTK